LEVVYTTTQSQAEYRARASCLWWANARVYGDMVGLPNLIRHPYPNRCHTFDLDIAAQITGTYSDDASDARALIRQCFREFEPQILFMRDKWRYLHSQEEFATAQSD